MKSEVHNCECVSFMRNLPDKCYDLAIADPPYGGANAPQMEGGGDSADCFNGTRVGWGGGGRHYVFGLRKRNRAYQNRRDLGGEVRKKIVEWDTAPGEDFFKELCRVSRNQIIWGANYFPNMPPTRCFVVWRKLSISENFSMAMVEYAWTSMNGNAKFFECVPQDATKTRFHPTQKPVALYSWLLRMFAKEGDKIFDPMMGSQSSRVAAYFGGFDYEGCELDEAYFHAGNARFQRECLGVRFDRKGRRTEQGTLF